MLQLLGRATSGNVQKVIFGLEEMGLSYQRQDYGRQFGNTATAEYARLNPTRKVPTLLDDEVVVWESNTILRYLAAKAASPLYPTELTARSRVERWMDWLLASLNPVFLAGFRDARKPPAEQSAAVASDLAAELSLLEGALSGEWIAESFSLADIALGPIVRRCLGFPIGRPSLPRLEAWRDRLALRPAFTRATAAG